MAPPRTEQCAYGHTWTEESTYVRADGTRQCRICDRHRKREWSKKNPGRRKARVKAKPMQRQCDLSPCVMKHWAYGYCQRHAKLDAGYKERKRIRNEKWRDENRAAYNEGRRKRYVRHPRPRKSHCIHGHELTEENTYRPPNGNRECVTCRKGRIARRKKKAKPIKPSPNKITVIRAAKPAVPEPEPQKPLVQGETFTERMKEYRRMYEEAERRRSGNASKHTQQV